ncbi:uncharacterized protein Dere_GG17745 [Drosophila erecta]|uniref:Uncharacterized protein n=1 Tax=Drosophila erecta TaxID=7220 RepID=A0A0Q5TJX3_DROER|nr:uncharacterized protein Dere_GG17745 [Drosophila erecta]
MLRAFAFTVLLTALTSSQGHRGDYLRFPDPGNIPRYNQRPCGPRVCGKSEFCYRSFESICDFNDYNLKMILSGQELFELTDPSYCRASPPRTKLIDVGYYFNHQSLLVAQSQPLAFSSPIPRPNIPQNPENSERYHANPSNDFYGPVQRRVLPYPVWPFKRPQSPPRNPPVSYRPPYWYYPTRRPEVTKPCYHETTTTTSAPKTTTTTKASTTTTTTEPSTPTKVAFTTTTMSTEAPTTTTTGSTSTSTTTEKITTTTELTTVTEPATTTESVTTTKSPTSTEPSTTNSASTTTESSTTTNTSSSSTTITTVQTTEPSTTTTLVPPTTTTLAESSTVTTTPTSTTTTSEPSTTSTTDSSTSTTTTVAPVTTTTTTEASTTTNPATVNPVFVEIRNEDGQIVDFEMAAMAVNPETGEPNCAEVTNVLITTGSRIVFQFSGCIVASLATDPTTSTSTTVPTTTQNTPRYQWYGGSSAYAQSQFIYTY